MTQFYADNRPMTQRELRDAGMIAPRGGWHKATKRTPTGGRSSRPQSGSFRQSVATHTITLYGTEQNGYVTGLSAMNRAPKGSDGCTVKALDYIGKADERPKKS